MYNTPLAANKDVELYILLAMISSNEIVHFVTTVLCHSKNGKHLKILKFK